MDPDPLQYLDIYLIASIGFWNISFGVFLLILLLFLSAMISASEVALFSLKPNDLKKLEETYHKAFKKIEKLREKPKYLLANILISNNFINIAIVILSYFLLSKMLPDTVYNKLAENTVSIFGEGLRTNKQWAAIYNFIISTTSITFLLVLFGEVSPKIYANLNNVKHSRMMATPLLILESLYRPISTLLVEWSSGIERKIYEKRLILTGNPTDKKDIDAAIDLAVSADDSGEIDILKGIINFGDVSAKQIMKSRVDVIALNISADFGQVMKVVRDSGFSRIPIFKEDFDAILGLLYVKDLLGYSNEGNNFNWQKLIRKNVLYVPESKRLYDLLREFQAKRTHIAIVVDEYGGSAGIVTLEDIMEEVIGDIKDEFDLDEEVIYTKIDEHNYIFEGKTMLNDVVRLLDLNNDIFDDVKGSADSLAGLILELLGTMPKRDIEIKFKDLHFKIISVSKRRIEKINIHL
ncbi:MAG: gliding motility-associated protein GldE [Saprospiraceae bacterium]